MPADRKNVDIVVRARTEGLGNVGRAAANFFVLQEVFGQLAGGVAQLSPALGRMFQDIGRNIALIKGLGEFGAKGAIFGGVAGALTTVMSAVAESHARAKQEAEAHAKAIDALEQSYRNATREMERMRGQMFAGNEQEIDQLRAKLKELTEQQFDPGDWFSQARRGLAGEARKDQERLFEERRRLEIEAAQKALAAQEKLRAQRLVILETERDERVRQVQAEELAIRLRAAGLETESRRVEIAERYRHEMVEAGKESLALSERLAMAARAAAKRDADLAALEAKRIQQSSGVAAVVSRMGTRGGQYADPAERSARILGDLKGLQARMVQLLGEIAAKSGNKSPALRTAEVNNPSGN